MTPLDPKTSTEAERLQQQAAQQAAQEILINTTIKLAVEAMYTRAQQSCWEIKTTIQTSNGTDLSFGPTQEDVVAQLCAIPNEFERARTFNLLAKENAFNLSIKTAGPKSPESAARKANTRSYIDRPLGDAARVSVVSSYVHRLDWMADELHKALAAKAQPVEGLGQEIEDWEMSGNALLRKVLKTNVDGIGAEVQFLPREQSRMAARITHHFFKVTRLYDDVRATLRESSDDFIRLIKVDEPYKIALFPGTEAYAIAEKLSTRSKEMLDTYSTLATFMNRLCSDEIMRDSDREEFNAMLRNIDTSPHTYDDVREGGPESDKPYSPIFKHMKDIKTYRAYMKEKGAEIGLFPLPELTKYSSPEEVESAMRGLRKCSQLTHACYMDDAKEPMRNLWVTKARETNVILGIQNRDAEMIPECAINCVNHTLDKDPARDAQRKGGGHAR